MNPAQTASSASAITVALIAGAASVVSVAISSLTAIFTARANRRVAGEQRALESQLGLVGETRALAMEELRAALKAISDALEATQAVKDDLRLILFAVPGSLDTATALGRLEASLDRLTRVYGASHSHFSRAEREACHSGKNVGLEARERLLEALRGSDDVATLTDLDRADLWRIHSHLTEVQDLLRDRRFDRLAEATGVRLPAAGRSS